MFALLIFFDYLCQVLLQTIYPPVFYTEFEPLTSNFNLNASFKKSQLTFVIDNRYQAEDEDELSLEVGDVVQVIEYEDPEEQVC